MNAPVVHSGTFEAASSVEASSLRLRVCDNLSQIQKDWEALEKTGVCTVYQCYRWCSTWVKHLAQSQKIKPLAVIAENVLGETVFILPLQLRRSMGVRIVEALTAPLGAYGFGVFQRQFFKSSAPDWFEKHLPDLIATLPKHDVFVLADIAERFDGRLNPLLAAGAFKSSNHCHIIDLEADFQSLYERKRPGKRRRYLRNRDAKLEAMGALAFDLPHQPHDIRKTMATMFEDQKDRLAEAGIHDVFNEKEKQFLIDLALPTESGSALLRPYRLTLDGKLLAVVSGAYFRKTFWALISSLAAHEARKFSPGDYALRNAIQSLCGGAAKHYDFSAGDAAYKQHWSDRQLQLHMIVRANTLVGVIAAGLMLLREKTKRLAKGTPLIFFGLTEMRRLLRGTTASQEG
jgi:CelD/BcsL family acetyltransferase involved in cellulose biosynthesis